MKIAYEKGNIDNWENSGRDFVSYFLRTIVGIESRSKDKLDYWDRKLLISSRVAEVKEDRELGVWVLSDE